MKQLKNVIRDGFPSGCLNAQLGSAKSSSTSIGSSTSKLGDGKEEAVYQVSKARKQIKVLNALLVMRSTRTPQCVAPLAIHADEYPERALPELRLDCGPLSLMRAVRPNVLRQMDPDANKRPTRARGGELKKGRRELE